MTRMPALRFLAAFLVYVQRRRDEAERERIGARVSRRSAGIWEPGIWTSEPP